METERERDRERRRQRWIKGGCLGKRYDRKKREKERKVIERRGKMRERRCGRFSLSIRAITRLPSIEGVACSRGVEEVPTN